MPERTRADDSSETRSGPHLSRDRDLRILTWANFVEELDETLARQTAEWGKQTGVKVSIERVPIEHLQSHVAASLAAGEGPDIVELEHNWAWLYADRLADVTAVNEQVKREVGDYYETLESQANIGGVYRAVPHAIVPAAFPYRTDYLKEAGAGVPTTWDDFVSVARTMKEYGKPVGQSLGHTPGDPNPFWYSWLWAHGGREVEPDGRTVALNTPETLAAVEKAVDLFPDLADGALHWDDGSNNRAFLAGDISLTMNSSAIYFVACRDYPQVAAAMDHFSWPSGPAGCFGVHNSFHFAVTGYSRNVDAARELLSFLMSAGPMEERMSVGKTFQVGPSPKFADHPAFEKDPKLLAMREVLKNVKSTWWGWPGPPSAATAEVYSQYVVIDLFAKACSGEMKPAEALDWAEARLREIYASRTRVG